MSEQTATGASRGRAWDVLGVVVLTLVAAMSGVLECLLVPLYAGSVVVPIAVVLALVGNVALPRLARDLVPALWACLLPFLAWLAVIVAFGVTGRPEGDVVLPGSGGAMVWVGYGVMLGGALAGTIGVITATPVRRRVSR